MNIPDRLRDVDVSNVYDVFEATAAERGDALAVEMNGREFSYTDLESRAARFAGGLRERGLDAGDRLLVYLPNCPEYVVGSLGAFRAGVVVSPVNPQYKARELGHQLTDTEAAAVLTHPALREHLDEACEEHGLDPTIVEVGEGSPGAVAFGAVDADPVRADTTLDTVAMQPYTSGTTGKPKGVHLTHRNLHAQAYSGFQLSEVPPEEEKSLAVLPLYHITGFVHSTWQPLVRGGSVYLRNPGEWDPVETMRTMEEAEVTGFIGVATMFVDMVNHERFGEFDLSSLETVNQGGAKMPTAVQETFEETASLSMSEGYGLTETTAATHTGHGTTYGPKLGSIGQPLRMTDCKIVDDDGEEVEPGETGELLVRGPQVMDGYHGLPEATRRAFTDAGYFRTGDVARRDEDNYYEIVDRKKHTINTAGYNVYPSEVESLLYEHEGVADVAVVGVPDERRNEVPKAFVVPANEQVTPEELKEFTLENLAEYKHPREVEFVESFPRTASGKVRKFKLVEDEEGDDE
ncbi:class I adenylate-forming enzyme family protein [Halospeciosus flavus]|uniref:Class I adenylate-forming enzyme family protein n=1 Tax=Halospeciosus flavus TaxID=3032283 RepID=A0ABD5Z0K6_9EURY|nr:AMP-binding protein [Halospeciosus flavus]